MNDPKGAVPGGITWIDTEYGAAVGPSVLAEAEAIRWLDALESTAERIARETTIVSLTREGDAMVLYTKNGDHEVKSARICEALTAADLRVMLSSAVEIHARRMFDTAELGDEQ